MPLLTDSLIGELVAEIIRTSRSTILLEPTFDTVRLCSTESSLICNSGERFPISSRNSVPLLASSNFPIRVSFASVKAPFSWPNISDSNKVDVTAPKSTEIKGSSDRFDRLWIAWATTSFPVPFSPRINTLASVVATCSMTWVPPAWKVTWR